MHYITSHHITVFGLKFKVEDKPRALTERKIERQRDDVEIVDDDHFDGLAAYYADGDKVCMSIDVYLYIYIYIYVHTSLHTHIHTYTHLYTCMFRCVHTYIHTYVHTIGGGSRARVQR
jgi:hypothetical protein